MSESGIEGIEIRDSHPDPGKRVWVAIDCDGFAVAVFVAFLPAPGKAADAFDKGAYTVARARDRGIAKLLVRHARQALAAEDPPITLWDSGIATVAGRRLASAVGIERHPGTEAFLAAKGVEYNPFDQAKADEEGFTALREAAARLDLPEPTR